MNKEIIVIGSGFSSLAAASYLAKAGNRVKILEKNEHIGGRARQWKKEGFTFDMGPTFYWMPDVFERFFNDFGYKVNDFYQLEKLDPGYEIVFGKNDRIAVSEKFDETKAIFESIETGAGEQLDKFIAKAEDNYNLAIKDLVYQPGKSIFEIVSFKTFLKLGQFFSNIKAQAARYFKDQKLRMLLEFPVLFLGAKPGNTPSFYNFMNYADLKLGTWHPKGGMYSVVEGMKELAEGLGVEIIRNCPVTQINVKDNRVISVSSNKEVFSCDILLSGADYHHTETLLENSFRQYSERYWNKKTFAPSALLFYMGFDKEIKDVSHHTLFFDTDFDRHSASIYDKIEWPEEPLFYASFPGKSDPAMVPKGKEGAIILIPLAPGLKDDANTHKLYQEKILNRLESLTDQKLKKHLIFSKTFSVSDFIKDYNSYKGNAYGLANTLRQTHLLRPRLESKKVDNLFYTGQLTLPGPGVPPSLISGKIVSDLIINKYEK